MELLSQLTANLMPAALADLEKKKRENNEGLTSDFVPVYVAKLMDEASCMCVCLLMQVRNVLGT